MGDEVPLTITHVSHKKPINNPKHQMTMMMLEEDELMNQYNSKDEYQVEFKFDSKGKASKHLRRKEVPVNEEHNIYHKIVNHKKDEEPQKLIFENYGQEGEEERKGLLFLFCVI
jgi:hypothetical protein